MRIQTLFAVSALVALAGCSSAPKPRPRPVPQPAPAYVPPAPKPLASDWRDWPYTPGDWRYAQDARGSTASFGAPASFTIRCDLAANAVYLSRGGTTAAAGAGAMTIRTSTTLRTLSVQPNGGWLVVSLTPRDTILEAMAFSRGRFVIEQPGLPTLVLPSWAEIGRVTEDCRR